MKEHTAPRQLLWHAHVVLRYIRHTSAGSHFFALWNNCPCIKHAASLINSRCMRNAAGVACFEVEKDLSHHLKHNKDACVSSRQGVVHST